MLRINGRRPEQASQVAIMISGVTDTRELLSLERLESRGVLPAPVFNMAVSKREILPVLVIGRKINPVPAPGKIKHASEHGESRFVNEHESLRRRRLSDLGRPVEDEGFFQR